MSTDLTKLPGFLRIREEVLLYVIAKTSLSEKEVLDEIYLAIYGRLSKPRDIRFNSRGWSVQKASLQIKGCQLYLSISVSRWDFLVAKVSIPKFNKERVISLDGIKRQAEDTITSLVEESFTG